jgi:hypothetical protein
MFASLSCVHDTFDLTYPIALRNAISPGLVILMTLYPANPPILTKCTNLIDPAVPSDPSNPSDPTNPTKPRGCAVCSRGEGAFETALQ